MNSTGSDGLLRFMRLALDLKKIQRQGWIDRGVPNPESSADHSWSLALFAWLLAEGRADLNAERIMLMALVHDLPEALAGDATPFDRHRADDGTIAADHFRTAPIYDESETDEKHRREREALMHMTGSLHPDLRELLVAAWDEYTAGQTDEARFVRNLDKLETVLQAESYLKDHPGIVIDSFRAGADRDIDDPQLRTLLASIRGSSQAN